MLNFMTVLQQLCEKVKIEKVKKFVYSSCKPYVLQCFPGIQIYVVNIFPCYFNLQK